MNADGERIALQILARRWSIPVITALAQRDDVHFLELHRQLGVTQKVLGDHLRFLVRHGVLRRVATESPGRVYYSLTEAGADLLPIVEQLRRWAALWLRAR